MNLGKGNKTMQTTNKGYDQIGAMMSWEEGELDEEATVTLFQSLIDSGLAWSLQGCYGRQAQALIDAGYCHKQGGQ
jgi:hypothetical protein